MTNEEMEKIIESQKAMIADLEAERDSLKSENDELIEKGKSAAEELRRTKELNFTLARQVSREPVKSAEEVLSEMF